MEFHSLFPWNTMANLGMGGELFKLAFIPTDPIQIYIIVIVVCYLSLLHRHYNAEHLPIEESDEPDYGEGDHLDDREIDLE